MTMETKPRQEFEQQATAKERGFVREFWRFALDNKKWWMIPIVVVLLLVGILVLITSTGAGALIYPLF